MRRSRNAAVAHRCSRRTQAPTRGFSASTATSSTTRRGWRRFRGDLLEGAHADVFRMKAHVLNCDELDESRQPRIRLARAALAPGDEALQLRGARVVVGKSRAASGRERRLQPGLHWESRRDLADGTTWADDPLRCLHVCFLSRRAATGTTGPGRPSLAESRVFDRGADRVAEATRAPPQPPPQIRSYSARARTGSASGMRAANRVTVDASPFSVHARSSRSLGFRRAPHTDAIRGARQSRRQRPRAPGRRRDLRAARPGAREPRQQAPVRAPSRRQLDESQQRRRRTPAQGGLCDGAVHGARPRSGGLARARGRRPRASSTETEAGLAREREGGESALRRRAGKEFLVRKYSWGVELGLDDPWLRLGTNPRLLDLANAYLGMWSKLEYVDVWYTPPAGERRAQVVAALAPRLQRPPPAEGVPLPRRRRRGGGPVRVRAAQRARRRARGLWPWRPLGDNYPPEDELARQHRRPRRSRSRRRRERSSSATPSGFHRGGFATAKPRVLATFDLLLAGFAEGALRAELRFVPNGSAAERRTALRAHLDEFVTRRARSSTRAAAARRRAAAAGEAPAGRVAVAGVEHVERDGVVALRRAGGASARAACKRRRRRSSFPR